MPKLLARPEVISYSLLGFGIETNVRNVCKYNIRLIVKSLPLIKSTGVVNINERGAAVKGVLVNSRNRLRNKNRLYMVVSCKIVILKLGDIFGNYNTYYN